MSTAMKAGPLARDAAAANHWGAGAATDAALAPAAVRTVGLRKTYRGVVAVDSIDLEVPMGSVMGMLGPNGSGKTTAIRMLLGLTSPTAGSVELLGEPQPQGAAAVLPEVGALVEGPGFHPFLSGRDNLRRCAAAEPSLANKEIAAAVDEALERVGLADAAGRKYRGYSLGMKQRLGLAAALLVSRRLVILDEPTNGLDPAGTREVRRVIADLHAAGTTVLVSSHLLAEVEATCTHAAVLNRGRVVTQGPLDELLAPEDSALLIQTDDAAAGVAALSDAGIASCVEDGLVRAELAGAAAPDAVRAMVAAGLDVHEARRRRAGLEELFASLTEEQR